MTSDGLRRLALHIDDLAASLGANVALEDTFRVGSVLSGSVVVNGPWLPDLVERVADLDVDLGVHLTLNAESATFRWRPLSTGSRTSGLIDPDGFMWPDVPSLRVHADPAAVRDELTAQIAAAGEAGLAASHLDHHMGAALAPEFVEVTVDVAIAHQLPTLFPADIPGYVAGVDWYDDELGPLREQRERLVAAGLAFADRFVIPLRSLGDPVRPVLEAVVTDAMPGLDFVSLHCAADIDIVAIHPGDGAWRIEEHRLLSDPEFVAWIGSSGVELVDVRSQT
jgi:hypothetical protein